MLHRALVSDQHSIVDRVRLAQPKLEFSTQSTRIRTAVIRPNLKLKIISARDMTALLYIQLLFAPKIGATPQAGR
jgi:hypothetical protein